MIENLIALAVAQEVAGQKIVLDKAKKEYEASVVASGVKYRVAFDVSSRGNVQSDFTEFEKIAHETLTDSRGWIRAGVKFEKVANGGKMHVVIASGAEIEKYAGCSAELSCTVYPYVLINDERWRKATDSYNNANLSLDSYRQMVINHEVGHYLGHDHVTACGAGGVAPVMLQQSTGLRGCMGNSWPLASELWVSRW